MPSVRQAHNGDYVPVDYDELVEFQLNQHSNPRHVLSNLRHCWSELDPSARGQAL